MLGKMVVAQFPGLVSTLPPSKHIRIPDSTEVRFVHSGFSSGGNYFFNSIRLRQTKPGIGLSFRNLLQKCYPILALMFELVEFGYGLTEG